MRQSIVKCNVTMSTSALKCTVSNAALSILMLVGSSAAFAQNSDTQSGTAVPSTASYAQDAAAATSDQVGVGDIIVTAQRFNETAQKTPLILSVIGGDELKGVSEVRQLQSLDPGIQLGGSGSVTQTFIRGVGSVSVLNGQESSIAYNVDGVFLFTPSMITPLMYDLERIEVLKGPQGTLYGRNASGGAINLLTVGAKLGRTEGYVEGEYGNFDRLRAAGAVNVPLGDTLAVRLSGQHVEHDGYLSDGTDDQDLTAGRIRVRWEPSPDVTLQVGGDISHQAANGPGSSVNPNPTSDKWIGGYDPRLDTGPFFIGGTSLNSLPPNAPPFWRNNQWSVNAQLDVNLGFATLTVLPAYRHERARFLNYVTGYSDGGQGRLREKTVEARLANRTDALKWVVGAFYIDNEAFNVSIPRQDLIGSSLTAAQTFKLTSYAFFGEATATVADGFRVAGGLRYTHEKTRTAGTANSLLPPDTPSFNPLDPVTNPTGDPGDFVINNRSSASAMTWKVGAELDLSPSSLMFATASRGFKGGGTYANYPGFDSRFKPEYLTAFELGSRNRFFDNTLQINGELFYWKLKDQQLVYLGYNSFGQITLVTANAGKGHMYGANLDITWRPTPSDTLSGAIEYVKSKYDSFVRSVPSAFVLTNTHCSIINYAGPASFAPVTLDCSGQHTVRTPTWSATAAYEHRFDLADAGQLTFGADMTYASGRFLTIQYTDVSYQEGKALFNASLTYETQSKAITVTGWIRNIANSRVMANADQFFVQAYSRPILLPPRTFGLTVRYAF